MIVKNNKEISLIYKGTTPIKEIYRGSIKVFPDTIENKLIVTPSSYSFPYTGGSVNIQVTGLPEGASIYYETDGFNVSINPSGTSGILPLELEVTASPNETPNNRHGSLTFKFFNTEYTATAVFSFNQEGKPLIDNTIHSEVVMDSSNYLKLNADYAPASPLTITVNYTKLNGEMANYTPDDKMISNPFTIYPTEFDGSKSYSFTIEPSQDNTYRYLADNFKLI